MVNNHPQANHKGAKGDQDIFLMKGTLKNSLKTKPIN
jgi:hypothetical protein